MIKNIIIKKILKETLTSAEEFEFEKWMTASESNRILFERIKSQELTDIILQLDYNGLGNEMRDEFRRRVIEIRGERRKGLLRKVIYSVSAAAVIALSFLIFRNSPDVNSVIVNDVEIVSENLPKAVDGVQLITSDKVLNLDSNKELDVAKFIAESKMAEISSNPIINKLIVPLKKEYNIVLPDGTKVWLNSGSTLFFPNQFSDTLRSVELEGEGYFEVVKNEKAPFVVKTKYIDTKVLGTQFMVSSYSDKCEVALVEGSVKVNDKNHNSDMLLKPGKGAVLDLKSSTLKEVNINIDKILSIKSGLIIFDEDKLVDITNELKRWYGVDFVFENEQLKQELFYVKINKYDDISDIMELLKQTNKINYTIKNNSVIIKKYLPMN